MKRALIFGGGVYGEEFPVISDDDYIIAADAGLDILKKHGIRPHISIGDFDSSSFIPEENVIRLPVEKDVTDTCAASELAINNGCDEIYIYGGMGGRPDHTMANFTLIASLTEKGIRAYLSGEGYTVTAVKNSSVTVSARTGKTLSVFSWTDECTGVTLKGLKYTLSDYTLSNMFALGVSNSFSEDEAEISVRDGILIIMYENI